MENEWHRQLRITSRSMIIGVLIVIFIFVLPLTVQADLQFIGYYRDGVGGVDGLDGTYGVTVSPDGKHLYATGVYDDAVAVFRVRPTTMPGTPLLLLDDGV